MASGTIKYNAEFTGAELDEAVKYGLYMKRNSPFQLIDSTPDNPANLNEILNFGIFCITFYSNSYNDTLSGESILLKVYSVDEDTIGQRYDVGGKSVERNYIISEASWSEWVYTKSFSDAFMFASADEEIHVSVPTLVFREKA